MSLKDVKRRQFSVKVMHGIIPIKKELMNPSHIFFLVGIVRVFGSNFKAFKFSIYPNNMFKEYKLA